MTPWGRGPLVVTQGNTNQTLWQQCLKWFIKDSASLNPSFPSVYFALIGQMPQSVVIGLPLQRASKTIRSLPYLNFSTWGFLCASSVIQIMMVSVLLYQSHPLEMHAKWIYFHITRNSAKTKSKVRVKVHRYPMKTICWNYWQLVLGSSDWFFFCETIHFVLWNIAALSHSQTAILHTRANTHFREL